MTLISKTTNRALHSLLNSTGLLPHKADLVASFTNGRTEKSSEMNETEAKQMLRHLSLQKPVEYNPANKMRRKILAICHDLAWYKRDAAGNLILEKGKPVLDFDRIDSFCTARSKHKKPLQAHTAEELPSLVVSFQQLIKSDLK